MDIFPENKSRLHLEITGKCNLNCLYCFQSFWNTPKIIKQELTANQIYDLIEQAEQIGCKTVTITGGEPFTRKDIFKILDYCKDLEVEILTNSELLKGKTIKLIGKKYPQLKRIKISIDGFRGHNINRKPSDYRKILNNFKCFAEYTKCELIANTAITRYTVNELVRLYKTLKKIPINIWRIDLPFLAGRYKKNYKKCEVDPEYVVKKLKEMLILFFKDKKPFLLDIFNLYKSTMKTKGLFNFDIETHPCAYSQWETLCIEPNGDLKFCPSLSIRLASIFNKNGKIGIPNAIKRAKRHKFFKIKVKDIKECTECKYLNICGGGCRADALYWTGDIINIDPVACKYMKLMEKYIIPILPREERDYLVNLIRNNGSEYKKI